MICTVYFSNLRSINDKYSSLSSLFSSSDYQKFFKLPLAVSSYNQTHVESVMRVPMIHPDATFNNNNEKYIDGFVVLTNLFYKTYLTFSQYDNCIEDFQRLQTICFMRPCLVRAEETEFRCYSVSITDYLISKSTSKLQALCNGVLTELSSEDESNNFLHISVPTHCDLTSTQFSIKQVHTFRSVSTSAASLNNIFKIEEEQIVIEPSHNRNDSNKFKLKIPSRSIMLQLNKTRDDLNKVDRGAQIKIPDHFEPLSFFGTSVGSVALITVIILLIVLCRHL